MSVDVLLRDKNVEAIDEHDRYHIDSVQHAIWNDPHEAIVAAVALRRMMFETIDVPS